jgi:hypothetical protein
MRRNQDSSFGTSEAGRESLASRTPRGLEPSAAASTVVSQISTVMPIPTPDNLDPDILRSVIEHVFMPPKLPQWGPDEETEQKTNVALCDSLIEAAQDFLQIIPSSQSPLWKHMIKMIQLARRAAKVPLKTADLQHALSDMTLGGTYK